MFILFHNACFQIAKNDQYILLHLQVQQYLGISQTRLLDTNLEVVDGDKVGEEGQDVFDLKQVATRQTVHGFLHVFLLLHHMTSNFQPKLLPQLLIILR